MWALLTGLQQKILYTSLGSSCPYLYNVWNENLPNHPAKGLSAPPFPTLHQWPLNKIPIDSAFLTVLNLLSVPGWFFQSLDDKWWGGGDDGYFSLSVLDGELNSNTQSLPVLSCLGNVISNLLRGLKIFNMDSLNLIVYFPGGNQSSLPSKF